MKHLLKFNEELYYKGGEPMSRYYWLRSKNSYYRVTNKIITIGEFEPNNPDGSENVFPWNIIGSDEIFSDEDIRNRFDILDEIIPQK